MEQARAIASFADAIHTKAMPNTAFKTTIAMVLATKITYLYSNRCCMLQKFTGGSNKIWANNRQTNVKGNPINLSSHVWKIRYKTNKAIVNNADSEISGTAASSFSFWVSAFV